MVLYHLNHGILGPMTYQAKSLLCITGPKKALLYFILFGRKSCRHIIVEVALRVGAKIENTVVGVRSGYGQLEAIFSALTVLEMTACPAPFP